jgi:hypothetical protein
VKHSQPLDATSSSARALLLSPRERAVGDLKLSGGNFRTVDPGFTLRPNVAIHEDGF